MFLRGDGRRATAQAMSATRHRPQGAPRVGLPDDERALLESRRVSAQPSDAHVAKDQTEELERIGMAEERRRVLVVFLWTPIERIDRLTPDDPRNHGGHYARWHQARKQHATHGAEVEDAIPVGSLVVDHCEQKGARHVAAGAVVTGGAAGGLCVRSVCSARRRARTHFPLDGLFHSHTPNLSELIHRPRARARRVC